MHKSPKHRMNSLATLQPVSKNKPEPQRRTLWRETACRAAMAEKLPPNNLFICLFMRQTLLAHLLQYIVKQTDTYEFGVCVCVQCAASTSTVHTLGCHTRPCNCNWERRAVFIRRINYVVTSLCVCTVAVVGAVP